MKMYKMSIIKNQRKKKNNSNLVYILFVPGLLYLTHFIFLNPNNTITFGVQSLYYEFRPATIKIVSKDVFVFNGLLDTSKYDIIKHY